MENDTKRPGRPAKSGEPMAGRTRTMLYRHRKQAEITASIGNETSASTATLLDRLKQDLSRLDKDPEASKVSASRAIRELCHRYGIDPNHS
jgi:hypothetical protein